MIAFPLEYTAFLVDGSHNDTHALTRPPRFAIAKDLTAYHINKARDTRHPGVEQTAEKS